MRGGGGVLSFVVAGDAAQTAAVVGRLRLIGIAPSLGGVRGLACQSAMVAHHGLTPENRVRRGIVDGMARLSVGVETPPTSSRTSIARSLERSIPLVISQHDDSPG